MAIERRRFVRHKFSRLANPSCSILFPNPINYFTYTSSGLRAFFIDTIKNPGEMYFSRAIPASSDVPTIIKCKSFCNDWRALQSVLYNNRPTTIAQSPNSFAEDLNDKRYFFEVWSGGPNIKVFKVAKDGSLRTQIYSSAFSGDGTEQIAFDPFLSKVVWCSSSWQTLWRCDRDGFGLATWLPGFQCPATAIFDDGKFVIFNANNRTLRLYSIWNGVLLQTSAILPAGYVGYMNLSLDNIRNKAHLFVQTNLHGVWDIATNIFTSRMWTTVPGTNRSQGVYYKDWVYAKLTAREMVRYNWLTSIEESWDGVSYLQ